MTTFVRASVIGALWLAAATSAWAEGEFFNLGDGNAVTGLSHDGSVAAGTNPAEYFIWTVDTGVTGIGGQVPGGGVGGQAKISDDGTRVCGTSFNGASSFFEMSYYDVGGGAWIPLGGIGAFCTGGPGDETSSGWGISNDGTSVVGLGWFDFCGPAHAIQWDESSGMTVDLGSTVVDRSSRANAANEDGSVVVGWQDRMDGFRQGAVWDNGVQTIVETSGGDPASEATDVDAAGDWVVGIGGFATFDQAWRWSSATGLETLGMECPGCFMPRGFATGISNDGSVIVGFNREFPFGTTVPFIWTEESGMVNLNEFVASLGIDLEGFDLAQVLTVSGDGRSIGGVGIPEGGFFPSHGYVITLPADVPCAAGTVNAADGPIADVLTVNGSTGGAARVVTVAVLEEVWGDMTTPPAGPNPAKFALYLWLGAPDEQSVTPHPLNLGDMCFPTPFSGGEPQPRKIWNNIGKTNLLGEAEFPSEPAPSEIFRRPSGLNVPKVMTLQGFIFDNGSAADEPASITNAVIVEIVE